ncbi:MAG: multicopper oxidase domain-containing protein [Actinobacteria bacterium]|nr:multicopper oxidase domain-containing protein [Actinomycetota bacterium]
MAKSTDNDNAPAPESAGTTTQEREVREIVERMITQGRPVAVRTQRDVNRKTLIWILSGVTLLFTITLGLLIGITVFKDEAPKAQVAGPDPRAYAPAPTLEQAKGIKFEKYQWPDPALPATPAGPVKKFRIDVFEHVTQVRADLAPTRVWSYGINGELLRGTGGSPPMVVTEGDKVQMDLVNGGSMKMDVVMPHSIDFHSAEVAPNKDYVTILPGKTKRITFLAEHPGAFMYHCATKPVLMHTGAGMVGMMIVKPKNLAPVDRELWMTQQEFYIGEAGGNANYQKMQAKNPDVIAFNGFGDQYATKPITVAKGERVRMWLLNAGPSIWSAFHVIGTVFDKTVIEGTVGRDVQTVNLAPSQGGWVEFTLDEEGKYPFVTHAFGDMERGALGILATKGAPKTGGGH